MLVRISKMACTHTLGPEIRRQCPSFCENARKNKTPVRRTGDMFSRSGDTVEREETKNIDNSTTNSERRASSKYSK